MESDFPFAILALTLVLGATLSPGILRWLARRKLARGAESSDSAHCWICGAEAPERVAEEVYRCGACGQVQGEAAVAWRDQKRRQKLEAAPPKERLSSARTLLEQAGLELLAAEGELPAIRQLVPLTVHEEGG